ncbi:hypothetical protein HK101_002847 [Irineochytrium annulatum]|nr:hypothetical protein HK101_002847 [Irineochytrium annulatum]
MSKAREALFGSSSVLAALKANNRRLHRLYVLNLDVHRDRAHEEGKDHSSLVERALELADHRSVLVSRLSRSRMDSMSGNRPHNGLILEAGPLEVTGLTGMAGFGQKDGLYQAWVSKRDFIEFEFLKGKRDFPVWVAVDGVVDPQNLGSILRTSQFFGIDGVVVTERDTYVVCPFFKQLTHGTDISDPYAISCDGIKRYSLVTAPTVLVLGSESSGVSKGVTKRVDANLVIRGAMHAGIQVDKSERMLDSLNAMIALSAAVAGLAYLALLVYQSRMAALAGLNDNTTTGGGDFGPMMSAAPAVATAGATAAAVRRDQGSAEDFIVRRGDRFMAAAGV